MSPTGGPFDRQTPYLGREAELERLQQRLTRAAEGVGGLVLLRGPGGMGLTRTAHELAARADRAGMLVLWGDSPEGTVGRPFGALADALEEYGAGLGSAELSAELGREAPALTRLAPRLSLILNELVPAAPLGAEAERLRLHAAVFKWLARATARQPLMLVLDNVQWADGDTLLLLEYLAARAGQLPLLLLASEVSLPPLPEDEPPSPREMELRAALAGAAGTELVELRGLDEGDTTEMLARLAGKPISPAVARLIQQVSWGEPLWARELYRHLAEEKRLETAAGVALPFAADLPETLEQLVSWRMSRLGPEVRTALAALAAFGQGAEPTLLAQVAGLSRSRLIEYLEVAVGAGLCRSTARGQRYVVAHDRLRLAMLAGMSEAQRAQLQRWAAQALEAEWGDQAREHAGQLLHHYRRSASLEGAELGLRHGLLAAEQARAACAHMRAARCLDSCRALVSADQPRAAADLAGRLAQAQAEAGDFEQALVSAAAALRAERQLDRPAGEALEQLTTTLRVLRGEGLNGQAQAALDVLCRLGLELTSRAQPLARARLQLLAEHWQPLEWGAVKTLSWSALPVDVSRPLRESGKEADLAELLLPQRPRTRDESARAAGQARTWRTPSAVLRAMRAVALDLLTRLGLAREGASWAALYVSAAERYGSPRDILAGRLLLSRAQAMLGLLHQAEESLAVARGALAELPAAGWLPAELLLGELALGYYRDRDSGDSERLARRAAAASREVMPQGLALAAERCLANARLGRVEEARLFLPDVLAGCAALEPMTYYRDAALLSALAAAWELGAVEHAGRGETLLDLATARHVGGQPAGSLRLARARMLALAGRAVEARSLLAEERPALEAAGLRPLRAIADYDDALVVGAGGSSGRPGAVELLERAAQQFEALGMEGWLARASRLLAAQADADRD
jgi:hypothetical protein